MSPPPRGAIGSDEARSEGEKRELRTRAARRRQTSPGAFARPLEYDESGFPITPRVPSYSERLRRLILG
jgi:hypothetical protein